MTTVGGVFVDTTAAQRVTFGSPLRSYQGEVFADGHVGKTYHDIMVYQDRVIFEDGQFADERVAKGEPKPRRRRESARHGEPSVIQNPCSQPPKTE